MNPNGEMVQAPPQQVAVRDRYDEAEMVRTLKETVCKGATDSQFRMFIEICRGTGLNPFLKEIYFVPGVGVMAARDGYLRVANEHPMFDGMKTVVERDAKNVPIKATCSVWRKDRSHPIECEAYFSEYKKGGNVWSTYPSAMIGKVAEVLALKRSFSINGVVTEEEIGSLDTPEETKTRAEKIADAQQVAAEKIAALKAEPLTIEAAPITDEPQGQAPPAADWIAPMMKAFADMKESLGEDGYRMVITAAGFANKNELMKAGKTKAASVYKSMKLRRDYKTSFASLVGKHGAEAVLHGINRNGFESFERIPTADLETVYTAVETEMLGVR